MQKQVQRRSISFQCQRYICVQRMGVSGQDTTNRSSRPGNWRTPSSSNAPIVANFRGIEVEQESRQGRVIKPENETSRRRCLTHQPHQLPPSKGSINRRRIALKRDALERLFVPFFLLFILFDILFFCVRFSFSSSLSSQVVQSSGKDSLNGRSLMKPVQLK